MAKRGTRKTATTRARVARATKRTARTARATAATRRAATAAAIAYIPTEDDEQAALFYYLDSQTGKYPDLALAYHVPNGANYGPNPKLRVIQATRMRRIGLKKGVPDVVIPIARGGYHGLYIEMKRTKQGSEWTEEQKWYAMALTRQGYKTELCYGATPAIKAVADYMMQPPTMVCDAPGNPKE